jgi:hypothetical protein
MCEINESPEEEMIGDLVLDAMAPEHAAQRGVSSSYLAELKVRARAAKAKLAKLRRERARTSPKSR